MQTWFKQLSMFLDKMAAPAALGCRSAGQGDPRKKTSYPQNQIPDWYRHGTQCSETTSGACLGPWVPCFNLRDTSTFKLSTSEESPITKVVCLVLSSESEQVRSPGELETVSKAQNRLVFGRGDCKSGHIVCRRGYASASRGAVFGYPSHLQ